MRLEDQVCTKEQSERLKELGVAQEAYFDHVHFPETIYRVESQKIYSIFELEGIQDAGEKFSAFTVAELGVMLPESVKRDWYLEIRKLFNDSFQVSYTEYYEGGGDEDHLKQESPTEAQARAAMLIYLLEKKLVTSEKVNNK